MASLLPAVPERADHDKVKKRSAAKQGRKRNRVECAEGELCHVVTFPRALIWIVAQEETKRTIAAEI